ncbi:MAG: hypothetical protein M1822_001855 [Bathelium mastoideum]|nr:MAG: hypothetical protein M1822_001855 [Bathelium mastoideum]
MAKTPKLKRRPVSLRSRAARRGTSSSINTDKSLKDIEPPEETAHSPANVLGIRDGGITKKWKQKNLSRQQRLRQEKGIERADRNQDKLGKRVASSVEKAKRVKARRANWDDLNVTITKQKQSTGSKKLSKDMEDEPTSNESGANGGGIAMLGVQKPPSEESASVADRSDQEAIVDEIL